MNKHVIAQALSHGVIAKGQMAVVSTPADPVTKAGAQRKFPSLDLLMESMDSEEQGWHRPAQHVTISGPDALIELRDFITRLLCKTKCADDKHDWTNNHTHWDSRCHIEWCAICGYVKPTEPKPEQPQTDEEKK